MWNLEWDIPDSSMTGQVVGGLLRSQAFVVAPQKSTDPMQVSESNNTCLKPGPACLKSDMAWRGNYSGLNWAGLF